MNAKLTRINKTKIFRLGLDRGKSSFIPPSPFNSCSISFQMYISVENMALYVFIQNKRKFRVLDNEFTRLPGPLGTYSRMQAKSPLPAVFNVSFPFLKSTNVKLPLQKSRIHIWTEADGAGESRSAEVPSSIPD